MDKRNPTFLASHLSPRMVVIGLAVFVLPIVLLGCDSTNVSSSDGTYDFDFDVSDHNWEAFFTGYPVGWGERMELTSDDRSLPDSSSLSGNGLFVSAINKSDNVKMLFRRRIDGLNPGTRYEVQFTVRFATAVPSGCVGIGGSPGDAVRVLADASTHRPEAFVNEADQYRLNVQYRHSDPTEWYDRVQMGDIANARDCEEGRRYEMKELTSEAGHATVTADEEGQAWLLFGTRSGFEGQTSLFYTRFRAKLR